MSSNLILLLLATLLLSACGVKGDPTFPKGKTVPSLLENYPDIQTDQSLNETKSQSQK